MNLTNIEERAINVLHLKDVFTLYFFSEDIVEIEWHPKLERVEREHMVQMVRMIGENGGGRSWRVYVGTQDFLDVSTDAKKYVTSQEGQRFTKANAVLVDNLAKRLLYNFFVRFHNPIRPTRAFTNRKNAIDWLLAQD